MEGCPAARATQGVREQVLVAEVEVEAQMRLEVILPVEDPEVMVETENQTASLVFWIITPVVAPVQVEETLVASAEVVMIATDQEMDQIIMAEAEQETIQQAMEETVEEAW